MGFKTILVPTEQHDLMNSTLETALLLARKFDSYIEGFALRVDIPAAFAVGRRRRCADTAIETGNRGKREAEPNPFREIHARAWCAKRRRHKEPVMWMVERRPEGDQFLGNHGRVFDVTVLAKPGRDARGPRMSTLEAVLFESGRPILIAPPSPQPQMGTNVLIAWNCSTEQARATAFAVPILKRASRVIVLTVEGGAAVPGPTGQQLCRYLQLNEVPAKPLTVGLDGRLTGEAILAHAKALGCDLLIKGAYTQSRLRQMIFGGTTRYIMSHTELPVLMAH
jgi:nucleotide-binding universal stress UspA family protein